MRLFNRVLQSLLLIVLALNADIAAAQLVIEITGGASKQLPIAVVPFANEFGLRQSVTEVVGADLARSGQFRLVDSKGISPLPSEPSELNYQDWRSRGAEVILIGAVSTQTDGKIEIRFRLMDAVRQVQLTSFSTTAPANRLRATAHKIADIIYEKLTGDKGVFSTKIAYILKQGRRHYIKVADADGINDRTVLESPESILSLSWSPDGTRLAYVSFEQQKPVVYVQNVATGERRVVANFKGNNSGPAWSPDGKRLVVTLSKDGGSQLYSMSAEGGGAERLTRSSGIDTEAVFSPDGQWIAFTSDRGGSAQIYRMPAGGGGAQRLTFDGSYNVSPNFSPDGKRLAFIQRSEGMFRVAVLELDSGQVQALTDRGLDERPTFAPNGRMILYATQVGGRGVLAAVSSDGRVKQRLTTPSGEVREPAWGPLSNN